MKKKLLTKLLIILYLMGYITVYAESAVDEFNSFFQGTVIIPLRVLAVILFIILTGVDYTKTIYDKDASAKKANGRAVKRFIALTIIFFSDQIISLISKIV